MQKTLNMKNIYMYNSKKTLPAKVKQENKLE